MTSVGRGRGWGGNQDKGIPLRRPGELILSVDMEVDSLIAAVQGINLQDENESVATLKGVEELLKNQCQTEENLRLVVQCLHDRSLEDRQFGMKAAAAYGTVASLEVAGVKLRNILLLAVQKDFDDRAHLQTACNLKFLNAIALLGEIFHQVRLPNGSPIKILALAVLQYQDMLLSGEEHEMELFTTQLAVNGRKLYDCRPGELEELMLRVRTTLMSRNLSGQCRCWLLLALDLATNRYSPLSGQLQGFYQVHLGANAIMQLQRLHFGLKVDTNSSHTQANLACVAETSDAVTGDSGGGNADGILAKCKSVDQTIIENGAFKPRGDETRTGLLSAKPSVRGGRKMGEECRQEDLDQIKFGGSSDSGGKKFVPSGDDQVRRKGWGHKRQDVDQNEDIWGTRRGQKHEPWGHDDRFVKDDDFYGKQAQRGEETFRPRIIGGASGLRRDRKGSDGKDQKSTPKSETSKTEPEPIAVPPPPLTEEENWD
ncbi:uncharacterized protein LOC110837034 isoform X2 [Zootermopsis nevadensis]|nr:uncharacterized protein LOC110837034 isoform X2 [Zootermopsis nevadensis]XP_021934469.1 uncharacterized protein LOC110837034 isoform X2 [Zootermopsis nevadensis]XP_021934470.1 uncharacterized protein LOC110837034 isoform X2 [Zootermopsis nevadensis]XP_021934471.1 uncharacterized protein LOC110837034 isoform X2 [Zootermopsis nevadensis]XP_021934472.1 uncharacterized protein LOC110837034 isoform X2 [Zootermopsis nevadensis]